MKTVLRIVNRLNLGGPTYNVAILSRYLEPGYKTLLISGNKLDSEESSEFITKKYGIFPIYIKNMFRHINIVNDYKAYREIRRIIKEHKPVIVHTHAAKSGALGRLAAYHEKVPLIYHTFHGHVFHSYFNKLISFIYILSERFLAKISTKIIAISNAQKQELAEKYKICKRDKIIVVPLGFDLKRFQNNQKINRKIFKDRFSVKNEEITIGIISRLTAIKNHQFFLNAFRLLLDSTNKKVRGFIIGDGEDMNKLKDEASNLNISYTIPTDPLKNKELCFTSWQKDIEMINAGLDIVVLTSLNEGTPVSLIEAQAAGNPVVSTDVGGVKDIIINNKTGFIADKFNPAEFAEYIKQLVEDEVLREKMGIEGVKFVNKKFNFSRLVTDIKKLYNSDMQKNAIN